MINSATSLKALHTVSALEMVREKPTGELDPIRFPLSLDLFNDQSPMRQNLKDWDINNVRWWFKVTPHNDHFCPHKPATVGNPATIPVLEGI